MKNRVVKKFDPKYISCFNNWGPSDYNIFFNLYFNLIKIHFTKLNIKKEDNYYIIQLRDAIIDGTHPVSIEEAIQLAGIQCQAEMNNSTPEKQKLLHSRLEITFLFI